MGSVIVIGGGPAGASFATRMGQLGHHVTLVERSGFPRPRLGESLTPGVAALLSATGAWAAVAAERFPAARDVRVLWEADEVIRLKDGSQGLIVDRGRFDQILLAHAARQGVRVLQPATVTSRRRTEKGWEVEIAHGGARETICADLLAEAGGRSAMGPRTAQGARTIALHALWEGQDLPRRAMVAAAESGWFWAVPLPDGRVNAQCFLDPAALRRLPGSLEQRYRGLVAQSPLAAELAGAHLASAVAAADATAFLADEPVTADTIRVGDAAIALDPISSSGVQKALQTALSGAIVANTLLRRPALTAHAIAFYRDSLAHAAARHAAWAGEHYAAAARTRRNDFWRARAMPATPLPEVLELPKEIVTLSTEARLVACPCLGPEFVELREALTHPALAEPVAYLGGQPLAPLLALKGPRRLSEITAAWSALMPAATARAIAHWLCRNGVLVAARPQERAA